MQGNYYHLIGLLIIVGFSVISWIYRQLNEQAAKKRAKDMLEERRREMLRTGRDPGEVAAPAETSEESQRQREIATRREAQLAELRRRAHARQQSGEASARQAPVAPPINRIPGTAGPTVRQGRAPMGPPLRARPVPQQKPPPQQRAAPLQRQAPQQRPAQRPVKQKQSARPQPVMRAVEEEETTHRLVADEPVRRLSPVVSGAPQTPEEWRRAIIANEILSPPLAMRAGPAPVPF